jgi:acetyl/propionyl-CoA carboxylase alpha subunit
MRILIANRGEISRRIIRTAHRLGHQTVAVFADPDAGMPFVDEAQIAIRIGPSALSESYLSTDAILSAATSADATAVHPGYGFLSENAEFAQAVVDAGLTWIGPHPGAIVAMGSKIQARRLAEAAGVPIIPGFDESQDPEELRAAADRIGFPVLVKASAGGGGKGIRIADDPARFDGALLAAMEEARRSFGDDRVIIERYITRPRHVEVQVMGDRHGNVFDLGTRECSVQRRYQKLLEEAPAPNLDDATRTGMRKSAVSLAGSIGYDSAGTVEYVVDDDTGEFFFLEMNTRLQVEHPVTEYVTGLDLVELQVRAAAGEILDLGHISFDGHAFEARINAEDAWAGFAPQAGRVTDLVVPPDVRWDSGIVAGSEVTSHYDPMVAKLVVGGSDRETARLRLGAALDGIVIGGITTNAGFHRWLIDQPPLVAGRVTTRFLDEAELPPPPDEQEAARRAAALWAAHAAAGRAEGEVWQALGTMRFTPHRPHRVLHLGGRDVHDVEVESPDSAWTGVVDLAGRRVVVTVAGHSHTFRVLTRSERWAPGTGAVHGAAGAIQAPFPGVVADVRVASGQTVESGETLIVMDAMKMLYPLHALGGGTVAEVRVAPGETVVGGQILVTFSENGDPE